MKIQFYNFWKNPFFWTLNNREIIFLKFEFYPILNKKYINLIIFNFCIRIIK